MAKHGGMYDNTPEIRHSEKGGTKVVKTPKSEHGDGPKEKGVEGEGYPIHIKHMHERHLLHARHEHEHAHHDHHHGAHGKEEMHARHEKEHKEMHTRHEKEAGATGGSTDGEPIEKVEKGMKKE